MAVISELAVDSDGRIWAAVGQCGKVQVHRDEVGAWESRIQSQEVGSRVAEGQQAW